MQRADGFFANYNTIRQRTALMRAAVIQRNLLAAYRYSTSHLKRDELAKTAWCRFAVPGRLPPTHGRNDFNR